MNHIGPGLMSPVCVDAVKTSLRSLVTDLNTGTTVVVSTPTGTSIDTASGVVSRTEIDDTVTGYLSPLTSREIDEGGLYQEGDHRLLVSGESGVLAIDPTNASRVVIGSKTWLVVQVDLDTIGAIWHLVIRLSS